MESPVVSAEGMRAAEEAAFRAGVSAEALMDEAGAGIAATVSQFFPQPGRCIVFAGKGNNAGDAFVAAAHLQANGWKIELQQVFHDDDLGPLAGRKLAALRPVPSNSLGDSRRTIILDGLLGLGSKPPLREPVRSACRELNRLRTTQNAFVFAIDGPSGLDADSGEADEECVVADFTVTIGFAKRGLLADAALRFVGRLAVVPLPNLGSTPADDATIATAHSLQPLLPRRDFAAYKNQFSRVGVVAGSRGFCGAAVLCAWGALRGGAGLVNIFVLEEIYPIVAMAAPAEAMVRPVPDFKSLLDFPVDIWVVGPGLGTDRAAEIREIIRNGEGPMVLDADGLNIVAEDTGILAACRGPRLLTPHPGEMKRLFGEHVTESRSAQARRFVEEFPVTLLLKGSRTIVTEAGRPLSYNSTGNPGMSTGGIGDVLGGVCAALIGQALSPYDAARVASWVCGRAAERAIFNGAASEQSLLPRDVLDHLGAAFRELQDALV